MATSAASSTIAEAASTAAAAARRMIIFGGNGYVGSEVAKTALSRGWDVIVACRSGAPIVEAPWTSEASFVRIDALDREDVYRFLEDFATPETTAIVNCIGLLTMDHAAARRLNAEPMRNIAAALYEKKMPHLQQCVYLGANRMMPAPMVLRGYYAGKESGERSLRGDAGLGSSASIGASYTILRPSFIYGTRVVNERTSIPLGVVGYPLDLALSPLARVVPYMKDSVLAPPVSVAAVGAAAVMACEAPADFNNAVLEVADIKAAAARLAETAPTAANGV